MKGMQKIVRGSGFKGVVSYALLGQDDEINHGILIGGTMAGNDIESLSSEFFTVSARRPSIEKPVWHSSLRMPAGEAVSDEKWISIANDYMKKMGWDINKVQYSVFTHDDGEHIHIIANRVYSDLTVYLGQNENLKSTRIISELEVSHKLTKTKGVDRDESGKIIMPEVSKPSKKELEKALRLSIETGIGQKPIKIVLQEKVSEALKGKPNMSEFLKRLDNAGVASIPNMELSGKMNGFTFKYGDEPGYSGSKLGAKFNWDKLVKGINYEQARDSKELFERRRAKVNVSKNDGFTSDIDENRTGIRRDNIKESGLLFTSIDSHSRQYRQDEQRPDLTDGEFKFELNSSEITIKSANEIRNGIIENGRESLYFGRDHADDPGLRPADGCSNDVHVDTSGGEIIESAGSTGDTNVGETAVRSGEKKVIRDYSKEAIDWGKSIGAKILSDAGESREERLRRVEKEQKNAPDFGGFGM
jgi:hypothetical protein